MPEFIREVDHDAPDHDRAYCSTCDNRATDQPEKAHITVEIFGRETEVSADALRAAEATLALAWCHESLSPAEEATLESAIDIIRRLRGSATPPGTGTVDGD